MVKNKQQHDLKILIFCHFFAANDVDSLQSTQLRRGLPPPPPQPLPLWSLQNLHAHTLPHRDTHTYRPTIPTSCSVWLRPWNQFFNPLPHFLSPWSETNVVGRITPPFQCHSSTQPPTIPLFCLPLSPHPSFPSLLPPTESETFLYIRNVPMSKSWCSINTVSMYFTLWQYLRT
jgi:hypothetical protein